MYQLHKTSFKHRSSFQKICMFVHYNRILLFDMKPKSTFQLLFLGFLLMLLVISCNELPCAHYDGVKVNVGFYQSTGVAISDTSIKSFHLKLLTEIDTPYVENYLTATKKISFPLSMIEDSSTIILTFHDSVSDTLTFIYKRTLTLESHACGFDTFFEITEIKNTNNRLDSIWLRKDIIDYATEENIKIYF